LAGPRGKSSFRRGGSEDAYCLESRKILPYFLENDNEDDYHKKEGAGGRIERLQESGGLPVSLFRVGTLAFSLGA
jgi:hypothetical protein